MSVYSSLKGDQLKCSARGCQYPQSQNFVFHESGRSHPMHLECALEKIDDVQCSFCKREVDVASLLSLQERVNVMETDEALAREVEQEEVEQFARGEDAVEQQEEEDRRLAESLEETQTVDTGRDFALAQSLQEEENGEELSDDELSQHEIERLIPFQQGGIPNQVQQQPVAPAPRQRLDLQNLDANYRCQEITKGVAMLCLSVALGVLNHYYG